MRESELAAVRHDIAAAVFAGLGEISDQFGGVTLRRHQREAANRLASLIASRGGAMLAEPVGVGKTYTALAVGASLGGRLLLVVPAALRDMWTESLERCAMTASIISHEELSRGTRPRDTFDFVIVDESHRLRSPSARRYGALAEMCRQSRVLLVTATPVQNARADLAVQLALFLGREVWRMSEQEVASYVVRHRASEGDGRPGLSGPHLVELDIHDDCLDEILALPPPVPARDEAVVAALLSYSLIHQWTSSRAAIDRALQRRRARGIALAEAIEAGRQPTRGELAVWTYADDAMQLAFPEIVASQPLETSIDSVALRDSLDRHRAAVEQLLDRVRREPDPDDARAAALRRIRAAHPHERIIAFCHYAETVRTLRSKMANENGVAALTAQGARVAGGRLTRDEILAQFTVDAHGGPPVRAAERIELLITTDLLSEGLNLQEASVIVHLDLPWNPARLDQRVGRALRLGSRHEVVTVYTFAPPAAAERLLHIERRLREKLCIAQRAVGIAGQILPSAFGVSPLAPDLQHTPAQHGLAEQRSALHDALQRWIDVRRSASAPSDDVVAVAAASSTTCGFLALVRRRGELQLVSDVGAGIETGVASLLNAIAACDGPPSPADPIQATRTVDRLIDWLGARAGESLIDLRAVATVKSRHAALRRVSQTLARIPRHQRAALAPLVGAVRAVTTAKLGEGAERILDDLVRARLPDEAWLRAVATFSVLNVRDQTTRARHASTRNGHARDAILALILIAAADPSL